jgi:TolB-like protein
MQIGWHRVTTWLLAIAMLAVAGSVAQAADKAPAEKTRVAVRTFAAKGVDASVAGTIETSFCDALSKQPFDVICPDDLKALLSVKQADLGLGTCENDDDCIKSIAKLSEAKRVVTGEVSKLGDSFIVSVTMIDAESGKVLSRASDKTLKVEALLDKLEGLAKKLGAAK